MTQLLPGVQPEDRGITIRREPCCENVVVADEALERIIGHDDASAPRMLVDEDVVEQLVAHTPFRNVDAPARIARVDAGVVVHPVPGPWCAAIDHVETDTARVITVQQVIVDHGVHHTIAIDPASTADAMPWITLP